MRQKGNFKDGVMGIQSVFRNYKIDLDIILSHQMRDALSLHIEKLEELINKNTTYFQTLDITSQEKENFYRLVGSYQGLSLSLIAYAELIQQIEFKDFEKEFFS